MGQRIDGAVFQPSRQVFVENPAGSNTKVHHDEERLIPIFEEQVSAPYPFAYGFVVGVPSGDGDCLDCFILSDRHIRSGELVDCHPIGLLEQYQNGMDDHDVLAVPADEIDRIASIDLPAVVETLRTFLATVFAHDPDRTLDVGDFRYAEDATQLIDSLLGNV
jgi:inorganic pyrophosphatase